MQVRNMFSTKKKFSERLASCSYSKKDFPNRFLDGITYELMNDPIMLNKKENLTIDRTTLAKYNNKNPFYNSNIESVENNTNVYLDMDKFVTFVEEIHALKNDVAITKEIFLKSDLPNEKIFQSGYQYFSFIKILMKKLNNFYQFTSSVISKDEVETTEKKNLKNDLLDEPLKKIKECLAILKKNHFKACTSLKNSILEIELLFIDLKQRKKDWLTTIDEFSTDHHQLKIEAKNELITLKLELLQKIERFLKHSNKVLSRSKDRNILIFKGLQIIRQNYFIEWEKLHKELNPIFDGTLKKANPYTMQLNLVSIFKSKMPRINIPFRGFFYYPEKKNSAVVVRQIENFKSSFSPK